jgi:hypothetical protein
MKELINLFNNKPPRTTLEVMGIQNRPVLYVDFE